MPYDASNPPAFETMAPGAGAPPLIEGPFLMDAALTPNRSLPNVGFTVLMAVLAAASFLSGVAFVSIGAWPVVGFFGLDVALVWLAFRLSYRQGRLMEAVRVTQGAVHVARRHPTGHVRWWTAPTAFVQIAVAKPGDHDTQVQLRYAGKALILGAFLSPPERENFAAALGEAVTAARRIAQGSGGAT